MSGKKKYKPTPYADLPETKPISGGNDNMTKEEIKAERKKIIDEKKDEFNDKLKEKPEEKEHIEISIKLLDDYGTDLGVIKGLNPFIFTPFNEAEPNEQEKFTVEFLQELDTGKRVVRFSKPDGKTHKFTVVLTQLQDMVKLKYSGFDIETPSRMHGFVKGISSNKSIAPIGIGESIGFTNDRTKFFNREFVLNEDFIENIYSRWNILLSVKEFKQIVLCTFMGMCSSYLNKKIVPVINIWGEGLNIELLRMLILSPFGEPTYGFRDIYYKDKKSSKLDIDREIIPVVADLITYERDDAGIEKSGNGYYIDGHGQYYAPLFILSKTPSFKGVHINIQMDNIFKNHERPEKLFKVLSEIKEVLYSFSGQLSLWIGNELCHRASLDYYFEEALEEDMGAEKYPYANETEISINILANIIKQTISLIFSFGDGDWSFSWHDTKTIANALGRELFGEILELYNQNESIKTKNENIEAENNLYRFEIEKLEADNEELKKENKELMSKNAQLKSENKNIESENKKLERINEKNKSNNEKIESNNKLLESNSTKIKALIKKIKLFHTLLFAPSAMKYTKENIGYETETKGKKYVYIQSGEFSDIIKMSSKGRKSVFEYWEANKVDGTPKYGSKSQPYQRKMPVGKEKNRVWFYEFCISDLICKYPQKDTKSNKPQKSIPESGEKL